tara:strand:+ start:186 stop:518 length:333 start_codon:yes stop_codon:yes gene_type:complete
MVVLSLSIWALISQQSEIIKVSGYLNAKTDDLAAIELTKEALVKLGIDPAQYMVVRLQHHSNALVARNSLDTTRGYVLWRNKMEKRLEWSYMVRFKLVGSDWVCSLVIPK